MLAKLQKLLGVHKFAGLDGTVETALDRRAKVRVDGVQHLQMSSKEDGPHFTSPLLQVPGERAWQVLASRGQVHFSVEAGFLTWHVRTVV